MATLDERHESIHHDDLTLIEGRRLCQTAGLTWHGSATIESRMAAPKQRITRQTRKTTQPRISALFDRQIDSVWSGLGHQCREFAAGYNVELGAQELIVHCRPDIIVVTFAEGGELSLQLDRAHRAVSGLITSGCAKGICNFESPPLGFTLHDKRLRFVYAAREISEEDLAVRLLTQLTGGSEAS